MTTPAPGDNTVHLSILPLIEEGSKYIETITPNPIEVTVIPDFFYNDMPVSATIKAHTDIPPSTQFTGYYENKETKTILAIKIPITVTIKQGTTGSVFIYFTGTFGTIKTLSSKVNKFNGPQNHS